MLFLNLGLDFFKVILGPLFLIRAGLYNKYYQYSIFIANISLGIECLVTIFLIGFFQKSKELNYKLIITKIKNTKIKNYQRIVILALQLILLALLCFFFLAKSSYSITNWINAPRTGYQFHREGSGHLYALFVLFTSVSFSLILIYAKHNRTLFVALLLYYPIIRLFGSKGQFLNFFLTFYSVLWFRGFKSLNKLLLIGIPILAIAMLSMFQFSDIIGVVEYFDYYYNSTKFYEAYFNNKISLFNGKIFISSFWSMVPRFFYPEKPYVYGALLINEYFYPGMAAKGHTPAFGGPIAAYADFGIRGVVLSAFFSGKTFLTSLCYYFIFSKYSFSSMKNNIIVLLVFLYLFAPSFMMFFTFPSTGIIMLVFLCIFCFANRFNYNSLLRVNREISV